MGRKDSGVTLTALVVTIIVLLILAGITVAIMGNTGILNNATKSVGATKESTAQEEVELAWEDVTLDYLEQSANGEYTDSKINFYTKEKLNNALTTGEAQDLTYDSSANEFVIEYYSYTDDEVYTIRIPNGATNGDTVTANQNDDKKESTDTALATSLTQENYGEYIDYSIDLNGDGITTNDWKIFYNDGTNVYIIASDYMVTSQVPTDIGLSYSASETGNYSVKWESLQYKGSKSISSDIATKFKFSWLNSNTKSTNNNVKAVASLLDTSKWTSFVDSDYASYAIGSPTLEMYTESWNAKYEEEKMYCNNSNSTGYFLGTITKPTSYGVSSETLSSYDGYKDSLYYPHTATINKCGGYWLASNSMKNKNSIFVVKADGSIVDGNVQTSTYALRPVICLKATVEATQNENDIWELK